jgi:hypothetical protein
MARLFFIRGGLVAWITLALAASHVAADDAAAPGIVVLRNGNVLWGNIEEVGESYRIAAATTSILVPADQVDIACRSLKEAFDIQRGRVGPSMERRCELVRWCLRQDLLAEAAREILEIRAADPQNFALPSLELQLRQCLELRNLKTTPSTPPSPHTSGVVLASATEPAASPAISVNVQTQFVRSIQPMLLHSCATGGCHQPGSKQKLQLDRWALQGAGSPALVRRNLDAVLAQLDRQDPSHSPLLERGRTAHGQPNQPASKSLSALQSKLLLNWLNEVAGVKPPEPTPALADEAADQQDAEPLDFEEPLDDADFDFQPAKAAPAARFKPRDAFDPEIFNRRHAKRAFTGLPASLGSK